MNVRMLMIAAALVCSATVHAHGPSRQKVTEEVIVNAPPAKVWGIIADFCAISKWHPAVAQCTSDGGNGVGAKRTLRIGKVDGPQIVEELQAYDANAMQYKYKILTTDIKVLPVNTYSSFLTVSDSGDGKSKVQWRGGFYRSYPNNNPPPAQNDEAAVKAVTGVYKLGLENIKKLAEK